MSKVNVPTTTIVIPARNEDVTIASTIIELQKLLENVENVSIIVVDDGSSDDTKLRVKELMNSCERLKLVERSTSDGLGSALVTGFCTATSDFVTWISADGAVDPFALIRAIETVTQSSEVSLFYAHGKSRQNRPWIRRLASKTHAQLLQIIFGVNLHGFTGIFIAKQSFVMSHLPRSTKSLFTFEFAITCHRIGSNVTNLEINIRSDYRSQSSRAFSFRLIATNLIDIIKLKKLL